MHQAESNRWVAFAIMCGRTLPRFTSGGSYSVGRGPIYILLVDQQLPYIALTFATALPYFALIHLNARFWTEG